MPVGVGHGVGKGADDLKAQKVEDDDGNIAQAGQVELGQEGGGVHGVGGAAADGAVDAQPAHDERQQHLDDRAAVQNPCAVAHGEEAHIDDDPDEGQLDDEGGHKPQLHAGDDADEGGAHHRQRGHPQGEVDPVVPGHPAGHTPPGEGGANPVVQSFVAAEGGAQLRGDEAVGQQEGHDHEQPPEILAVAQRRHGSCRLRHEHHADDGEDGVRHFESLFLH